MLVHIPSSLNTWICSKLGKSTFQSFLVVGFESRLLENEWSNRTRRIRRLGGSSLGSGKGHPSRRAFRRVREDRVGLQPRHPDDHKFEAWPQQETHPGRFPGHRIESLDRHRQAQTGSGPDPGPGADLLSEPGLRHCSDTSGRVSGVLRRHRAPSFPVPLYLHHCQQVPLVLGQILLPPASLLRQMRCQ